MSYLLADSELFFSCTLYLCKTTVEARVQQGIVKSDQHWRGGHYVLPMCTFREAVALPEVRNNTLSALQY